MDKMIVVWHSKPSSIALHQIQTIIVIDIFETNTEIANIKFKIQYAKSKLDGVDVYGISSL